MKENDRLKKIRTEKGLTLAQFGEQIGLTPGAISDMERGRRGLTEQTRTSICREFKVNREWLVNGEGSMFLPDSSDELEALARRYALSREVLVFIEKLVNSEEDVQNAVIKLMLDTAATIKGQTTSPAVQKSFEEMSESEIADAVKSEREKEKEAKEESGRSSSTA